MIRHFGLIALAALAASPAPAAPAGKASKAAARPTPANWSRTVQLLPNGSYRRGNPAAPTTLVEYLSYTCPHCAALSRESAAGIAARVSQGLISVEVRHALRDGADLAAALLARCAGPRGFFPASEAIFAAQGEWLPRAVSVQQAESARLATLAPAQALSEVADKAGLIALVGRFGVTPARARACLADARQAKLLADQADAAWNGSKISGTPTLLIDGRDTGVGSWAELDPLLPPARP